MQLNEMASILSIIKVSYPQWANNLNPTDARAMLNLWTEMLKDYTYKTVQLAVKKICATNKFPPSIAETLEACRFIENGGQQELTEQQAWGLVRKAIANSTYHAEEQFQALPEEVQKVVGGPSMLRAWGCEDVGTLDTVIASNFMRSYKHSMTMHRENQALPRDIKDLMLEMKREKQERILELQDKNKKRDN